tara:strand:+ start:615 stop:962 length:348 start_codon:yes stop_codon:yes gene_type:complete
LYSVVGFFSTIFDFFIYNLITSYSPLSASYAKRISFLFGTANSFIFNRKITFKSKKKFSRELLKYFTVWGFSFYVNSLSHDFSLNYFEGYIPFAIATLSSIVINFFGAKLWVFKK